MSTAVCLIPEGPNYNRASFVAGLAAAGFSPASRARKIRNGDALVLWNRTRNDDALAREFEAAGAVVFVAENGYLGDKKGSEARRYAMALNQHNGVGRWCVGGSQRWEALKLELKPWRQEGKHILVLPQRSIGPVGVAMDRSWTERMVARLRKVTKRPVKVRPHPGRARPSLDPDLAGAWACVTWGSSAGLKAIVAGVPVFYGLPKWIGAAAASSDLLQIECPFVGDRLPMLQRLAWAQFGVDEIASGVAFSTLMGRAS